MKRLGLSFTAALLLGSASSAFAATVDLRIMETTDIHVHLADYDYYRDRHSDTHGLAKTAKLIRDARAEATNSILIDNGDLIQGNPLGDYMAKEHGLKAGEVHPVYKAMNLLDYDAGNLGNHEFNYGLDFLKESINDANFPYVSSNIYKPDGDDDLSNNDPYFTPYILLDREVTDRDGKKHTLKIGVIGFVPPQIMQWDKTNLDGKVVTGDIVEAAKRFVPEMKAKGADIVIAVPHSGLTAVTEQGMDENAAYYLSKVPGIDAILTGHAHQVFPSDGYKDLPGVDLAKGSINGIPVVMPGFWGSHLGLVDMTLDVDAKGKWTVADASGKTRAIYKREGRKAIPLVEAEQDILDAIKQEHEATIAYMREGVGETTARIHSYFALVQDDPSIQIVTNAQKWYVERLTKGSEYDGIPVLSAGAPFKAGGRGGPDYYTNIEPGAIALKNVADLYIYPNTLRAVLIDGATVREWLEMSAGAFNRISADGGEQPLLNPKFPSYNYDVIDGVTYEIDVSEPARYNKNGEVVNQEAHRIKNLRFNGKPIDPKAKFIVATNNYRASGGGHFPGLDGSNIIIEAPDENRTVLANYIFSLGKLDPSADNNWTFKDLPGDVQVSFESSPAAAEVIASDKMKVLGQGENGFSKFGLNL